MIENVASPSRVINIGRLGENEYTRILFPISDYLSMYPQAHFTLLNQLPGESQAYPVGSTATDDQYLYWTVTSTDLTKAGDGRCELIVLQGDVVAKSVIYMTHVDKTLDGGGDPPEAWVSWMERLAGIAADAETSATDAAGSATAAETAQGASESAQAAAEAAQEASEQAQRASESAQRGAEAAQDSAEAARNAAEAAQMVAEDAEAAAASSAGVAQASQGAAAASESNAGASALASEGYAVGKQDGSPVASGEYYHNNAKYYAELAMELAGQASAASEAIQVMDALANTLEPGSAATVTKTVDPETGAVTLTFGLPAGLTPNLSIGTVATGEPGTEASASITGTDEEPVLNLTIPKGDTGLPGVEASVSGNTLVITTNAR